MVKCEDFVCLATTTKQAKNEDPKKPLRINDFCGFQNIVITKNGSFKSFVDHQF